MITSFKTLSLTLLVLVGINACQKNNAGKTAALVGNWKLVRTKTGIGPAPAGWVPASGNATFQPSGVIGGSVFNGYSKYTLTDSFSITVTGNGVQEQKYFYQLKGDSLNMGNRACIEGCSMQFVRVK
ncbi:hypothetical protein [Mucilaginibacter phyllosphaerae]|uniref:Lipocalin-like domain-containing protein n=1 Tax=Mucilaginibacter phyllosphaerae TaxID=1812349 RepID=A0A4Y8AJX2_9SPHI|nr:hypothetical protein [Mucilaginibacter phyllosphaerae]MBB3967613.1 hypothetical protein [Mucilaginibacter phyllosphaerae]TEW69330.1 hypothetical protein E2R65_03950 [Mucilaginibacter phyllosphaerae]GGH21695.1 hypothetical protein GCM10007352_34620 [Mucilaginibacter phyllosphaerae]